MNKDLIKKVDDDYAKHPMLFAGPAIEPDIVQIEQFVGFKLPDDYRHFISRYGAGIVGPYSIIGIGASGAMSQNEKSTILVTKRFRAMNWPGCENSLVISVDHAGNPITIDSAGVIKCFDHDAGITEQIASSFNDFIANWCLK